MRVKTLSDRRHKKLLHVNTASGANRLKTALLLSLLFVFIVAHRLGVVLLGQAECVRQPFIVVTRTHVVWHSGMISSKEPTIMKLR